MLFHTSFICYSFDSVIFSSKLLEYILKSAQGEHLSISESSSEAVIAQQYVIVQPTLPAYIQYIHIKQYYCPALIT